MSQRFRIFLIFFCINYTISLHAQIKPGFDATEAVEMIQLCTTYTFQDLYGSDKDIIPEGYIKYYESMVFGMDNKYQIFTKDSTAIICFRGSTANKISWIENMHAAMIPAHGKITIENDKFKYKLAKDRDAAVHAGYTHAMAYFYADVLKHINELNELGYYSFITTGHSQGGALSNILRAYLENLPDKIIPTECIFKTYAFAAPMIGNQKFVEEYNSNYCLNQTSFNIVNPKDGIPNLPASFDDTVGFIKNYIKFLENPMLINYKEVAMDAAYKIFGRGIIYYVQRIGESSKGQLIEEIGYYSLPKYVNDINYVYVGNKIEIPPFEYPKILKDSSNFKNKSSNTRSTKKTEKQYKDEPFGYQHKPYNYYVSFLKMYFPYEYEKLDRKYLPENL